MDLLIGGRLTRGAGEPIRVIEPATGDEIAEVPGASPEQTDDAVAAASEAFPTWNATPQQERSAALHDVAAALRTRRDDLADIATRETGRPRARNLLYVDWTADLFRMYAELSRVHGGRLAPGNDDGQLTLVRRVPYGVVVALVPWNYPLLLLANKVAPALAVGNTVVAKPAAETTLTTLAVAEILSAILPEGVCNVLAGGGDVGDQVVHDHRTHLVAFTGSSSTGRKVAAACAELTKPTHLELSGKDPAIVFDDADVVTAAEGVVWAAMLNAGQVCTSTERCYVHRSLHDAFIERAVAITEAIRVGDPFDEATHVGPMRDDRRRAHVLSHLDDARRRGAKVLTGGDPVEGPGWFLRPAVVVDVDHGMALMCEETFGPVLPIMAFDDDDEALGLAADTEYGLGASCYTTDPSRVRRVMSELAVGNVWINDPVVDNLAAPLGGMRASGDAREMGLEGLFAFTTTRHVHWNLALERKPWWFADS